MLLHSFAANSPSSTAQPYELRLEATAAQSYLSRRGLSGGKSAEATSAMALVMAFIGGLVFESFECRSLAALDPPDSASCAPRYGAGARPAGANKSGLSFLTLPTRRSTAQNAMA